MGQMPRIYKHKLGTPYRRNYSNGNLESALQAVVEDQLSFRQAEERFGVPRNTIYRKYRGLNSDRLGKPPVLTTPEEKNIVEALTVASGFGYPFTVKMLQQFVQQFLNRKGVNISFFKNNMPGMDWARAFLARNSELSNRMSQNIKRSRAEVSEEVIISYFRELRESIAGVPAENIINYDETNLSDDPGNEKVLVRRGSKHALRVMDTSKSSTSIMFAATGDGLLLPPYIVFKSKNVYPEWMEDGPLGTRYNRTDSGWFDADVFEDWFTSIAMPYLRRKQGKKVLIGDNLGSHLSYDIIKKCQENDIAFIFLPPNSTHVCQPLDVAVFGPMKSAWKQILRRWKLQNRGIVPKAELASKVKELLTVLNPTMSTNILSGFKSTGIIPIDSRQVLRKIISRTNSTTLSNNALIETFANIMEQTTSKEKTIPKREKKVNVPAGKSVSLKDFSNHPPETLEEEEKEENLQPGSSNENQNGLTDNFSESNDSILESNCDNIKTPVTNCDHLVPNMFIIAAFTYDEGTKKKRMKEFVAKIINVEKNNMYRVSCLRNYKEKGDTFVFPNVLDINVISQNQIKYKLSEPVICRGRHIFYGDAL